MSALLPDTPPTARDTEIGHCRSCQGTDLAPVPGPRLRWRYLRCRACGHMSLSPPPSELELREHYNGAYAVHLPSHLDSAGPQSQAVEALLGAVAPGRMLEIGCSYGGALAEFRSRGWAVEGVEMDERAARWARNNMTLRVHTGTLSDARENLRPPYDVVACYHVLEHIPDPHAFLLDVRELLTPEGLLVLRTPNASSFIARSVSGWWEWCVAPEHVHLFSVSSLRRTLEAAGFQTLRAITRQGGAASTLAELSRAAVRFALPRVARSGRNARPSVDVTDGIGVARPPRLIGLRRALDLLGYPLELAVAGAARLGAPIGPELMLVARRSPD